MKEVVGAFSTTNNVTRSSLVSHPRPPVWKSRWASGWPLNVSTCIKDTTSDMCAVSLKPWLQPTTSWSEVQLSSLTALHICKTQPLTCAPSLATCYFCHTGAMLDVSQQHYFQHFSTYRFAVSWQNRRVNPVFEYSEFDTLFTLHTNTWHLTGRITKSCRKFINRFLQNFNTANLPSVRFDTTILLFEKRSKLSETNFIHSTNLVDRASAHEYLSALTVATFFSCADRFVHVICTRYCDSLSVLRAALTYKIRFEALHKVKTIKRLFENKHYIQNTFRTPHCGSLQALFVVPVYYSDGAMWLSHVEGTQKWINNSRSYHHLTLQPLIHRSSNLHFLIYLLCYMTYSVFVRRKHHQKRINKHVVHVQHYSLCLIPDFNTPSRAVVHRLTRHRFEPPWGAVSLRSNILPQPPRPPIKVNIVYKKGWGLRSIQSPGRHCVAKVLSLTAIYPTEKERKRNELGT